MPDIDEGHQHPAPLEYERPRPQRSFDELPTDFGQRDIAEGQLRPSHRYRRLVWTCFALLALVLLTALLFR